MARNKRRTTRRKRGGARSRAQSFKWLVRVGVALLLVLLLLVIWANRNRILYHVQIDGKRYPITGIDLSSHNGDVDFERVHDQGVSFVYLKASEGVTFRDKKFRSNLAAARRAGLKAGAYHFFRMSRDGKQQAQLFAATVEGLTMDLPLVIDVEDWQNDKLVRDADKRARLAAMVSDLRQRGYDVMIYTNGDGYRKYVRGHFDHLPLWLCSFKSPAELDVIPHRFQQYSHWGEVPGVNGEVDLNIFTGSRLEWERWLNNPTPAPAQ